MTLRDRDLVSIQEARELAARAAEAQRKFAAFSQQQVDAIVEACAEAALAASEQLARLAVEETGYGNVADKMTKNRLAAVDVPRAIRGMKTVGIIREDKEKGIVEVATPVGVVAAIIPCTNPTSTAIYKTLIALKARNGVVLSPHPSAAKCICETARVMIQAAEKAGAPAGLVGCMGYTTLQGTQELMRHREVGVILATGGTGLVRSAYSSGKPAYGVGPGNVPAYIERTADVRKAVADILAGKTFDYGTICSSEQAIVADEAIAAQALEECQRQGAYFLKPEEIERLGALVIVPGAFTPNPKVVGRPATVIAEMAGISVPPATRVLIARLSEVGREHPLSAEKLSPILGFYAVANTAAAIELCTRLLRFGGAGHTASVHSQNEAAIREWGAAVPAFRVCVNTSAVHGSIGYSTNLFPAMTLGCGALGGNITSDNIGPHHLMNVKRIAWESRPIEHRTVPADQRMAGAAKAAAAAAAAASASAVAPAPAAASAASVDRAAIARAVEHVMSEHGIARGALAQGAAAKPAEKGSAPSTAEIASAVVEKVFGAKGASADAPDAATHVCSDPNCACKGEHAASAAAAPAPATEEKPAPVPFVSETDVRTAITRGHKILIGPKTILTPSARDLGSEHEVFVEAEPR